MTEGKGLPGSPDHGAVRRAWRPCQCRAMQRESELGTTGRTGGLSVVERLPLAVRDIVARDARALDATGPLCCRPARFGPPWPTMARLVPANPAFAYFLARGHDVAERARGARCASTRGARDAETARRGWRLTRAQAIVHARAGVGKKFARTTLPVVGARDPAGAGDSACRRPRPCGRGRLCLSAPETLRARATRPTSGRSPRSAC